VRECGVDLSGSCEHGSVLSGSINGGEFSDYLSHRPFFDES
jgi:hypothetical protein